MVLRPRHGLSLCAGAGGLDMGLMLAEPDFHTRAFVEWEEYPRKSIIAAQQAGYFAPAPIWDDLTTFDAKPLAGAIDTILAGYPCQPFSMAGQRRGTDDPRHLWPHVARIARELGDGLRWIFLENVAGHVTLGAEAVLRELRDMGFTPAVGLFSASEVGAPHERLRWFCVAHRAGRGCGIGGDASQQGRGRYADSGDEPVADADGRNASPERECGSGELGFQPEGGRTGAGALADAMRSGACSGAEPHAEPATVTAGRGQCAEPSNDHSTLADASGSGSQGRERPGSHGHRDRTPAHGSIAERGGLPIFPPGPGDHAAWASVMASSPDRAPSFSRSDIKSAAINFAAILGPVAAEAIEPDICGLSRLTELGPVVEKEGSLVAQTEAIACLRGVADGLASRSRALRLLGNGVHPLAAAHAWRTLADAHGLGRVDLATADGCAADGAGRSVWGAVR